MTEQGNVQPWRENIERVQEALDGAYPEINSAFREVHVDGMQALDALTTQIEELERGYLRLEHEAGRHSTRAQRVEECESIERVRERAGKEPLGVDISDYSDEFCAGFLEGQVNAIDAALTTQIEERDKRIEELRAQPANSVEWMLVVKDERDRAEKAERALAEIEISEPDWAKGVDENCETLRSIARAVLRPSEDTSDES